MNYLDQLENEQFRCWLNRLDARWDYEERRKTPVHIWRACFDNGYSADEAIHMSFFHFADLEM